MANCLNHKRTHRVLLLCVLFFFASCKHQEVPSHTSEKKRTERWIEDIAFFETEFLKKAKTYTDSSRTRTEKLLVDLKNNIVALSDFQIRLELSKAVVMANNGHTSLPLPQLKQIPIRFYRFSEGIHVVKTDSTYSKYLGAKLVKVNDIPVDILETSLFPYVSGIEPWKKFKTLGLITAPKVLHELGLGRKDSVRLSLITQLDTFDVTIAAQKVEKDRSWFEAWADLYPLPSKKSDWVFLKKNIETLPLYLRNAEKGVHYSFHEHEKIAYFQITSFWENCSDVKDEIKTFLEILKTKKDYNVVMDLRFYTGGNYAVFTDLASKPPKFINTDRKIYLVLSDKTYSAGIVTAARIKHYAKDKLVIVGQSVGDRLLFWAESKTITLPHSKIKIYSAQKEHDWQYNKRGLSRTHLTNFLYGVGVKDLNLDKEIELGFNDYMNNSDPIWEWILLNSI